VVDAAFAIAGRGTGCTLIEPPAGDPAHDTMDNTPTVSDSALTIHCTRRRPVLRALFISAFSP
jgi:hypothetical protein